MSTARDGVVDTLASSSGRGGVAARRGPPWGGWSGGEGGGGDGGWGVERWRDMGRVKGGPP